MAAGAGSLTVQLARPFDLIAFDWDGTAVMSRDEDAGPVRDLLDHLLRLGVSIFVVTGTNFGNIDRQFSARLHGPHKRRLFIATNRGSEVYGFDEDSRPVLRWQRAATPAEDRHLTASAEAVRAAVVARTGLDIAIIADRMNRRKVDLIPLPEWRDPPKSRIGDLLRAVEARLHGAGLAEGLGAVFALAQRIAREQGLADARITSDVKHIEIGLTDKADAIAWMMREVAGKQGLSAADVLIAGDEFGPIAGIAGSDAKMLIPEARGAVVVSVGPEPAGAPAGVLHLGGGPDRFRALLACQIAARQPQQPGALFAARDSAALPGALTDDPHWLLVDEGFNLAREHEIESLFAVANGYLGTRGSLAEGSALSSPATFIAGAFARRPQSPSVPELAPVPDWTHLTVAVDGQPLNLAQGTVIEHRRVLDLRQGILWREWRHRDPTGRLTHLRFLRLASLADRHVLLQSVTVTPDNYSGRLCLEHLLALPAAAEHALRAEPPDAPPEVEKQRPDAIVSAALETIALEATVAGTSMTVALACVSQFQSPADQPIVHHLQQDGREHREWWEWDAEIGGTYRLDQFVTVMTSRDSARPMDAAQANLERVRRTGAADLIRAHRQAWEERWRVADIALEGDESAQRALRFAGYHLISAANPEDETYSVAARALTGAGYKGHVFWDTEIYMLPFYTFTAPRAARMLLLYRFHTLPAAREKARSLGYCGALFAWESADTGVETAPPFGIDLDGAVSPILTGQLEHHISADVAYAVWQYWQATGDDDFFLRAGAELLLDTSRFWASRGQIEADGRYHIRHVIGPDEYHQDVDDDAYTNAMAQWNLERGAETAQILRQRWPDRWDELANRLAFSVEETDAWNRLAQATYVGGDPEAGILEQFGGYFALDDVDVAPAFDAAGPLAMAPGRQRLRQSQAIKQADVVLLLALRWNQFSVAARSANFSYYEPRTLHGSSLSPAIHALVAARLGETALALRYFRQAAAIDLSDAMGNAGAGVHMGALGGLWQAAIFGFAGVALRDGELQITPQLPAEWKRLGFSLQVRDSRVHVDLGTNPTSVQVSLEGGAALAVQVIGGERVTLEPGQRYSTMRRGADWERWRQMPP